jgi:hypothetical protein
LGIDCRLFGQKPSIVIILCLHRYFGTFELFLSIANLKRGVSSRPSLIGFSDHLGRLRELITGWRSARATSP